MEIRKGCNRMVVDVFKDKDNVDYSEGFEGVELLYKTCVRAKGLKE
jgi:hypothetical protein